MAVAAIQGADQHIRNSSGDSILPKDTAWQGESNQRHSDYKILALPLSQCRQSQSLGSVSHSVLILYGMWNRFWIIPCSDVTQWTGCIVGNVGTRFWKVRRMCRLNKGDISGSAVLILIICLYTVHNESSGVIGVQCRPMDWFSWLHVSHWVTWTQFIRLHKAPSGATKGFMLPFFSAYAVVLPKTCKHRHSQLLFFWNSRQKISCSLKIILPPEYDCVSPSQTADKLSNGFNTWLRFARGIFTFHPLCGACHSLNPAKPYWKVSQFYPADVKIGRREVIFYFRQDGIFAS